MGWNFRRRVNLFPGVSVNLSRGGPSFSFGPRGLKYTIGRNGIRKTFGIPGTGIYYTNYEKYKKNNNDNNSSDINNYGKLNFNQIPPTFKSHEEKLFYEGINHFYGNDFINAINLFEKSKLTDGYFMAGFISLTNKQYQQAENYFQYCIRNLPHLGIIGNNYKDNLELLIEITDYIHAPIDINKRGLFLCLQEIKQKNNNYADAINIVKQIMVENPDDKVISLAYLDLIANFQNANSMQIQESLNITSNIINDSPIDTNIIYLRAFLLYKLNLNDAAINVLTSITRKQKDRAPELICKIFYLRGRLYEIIGNKISANKDYQYIYAKQPTFKDVAQKLNIN